MRSNWQHGPDETQLQVIDVARHHVTWFGGRKIVWLAWGNGPPVVLLHGGFGSWTHFLDLIPILSERMTLWCPDMPGFGDSDMPLPGELTHTIPAALADGIFKLVPDREVDVIGFSFGTAMAGLLCGVLAGNSAGPSPRKLLLFAPSALGVEMARISGEHRLPPGLSRHERLAVHKNNLSLVMLSSEHCVDDRTVALQDVNVRRTRVRGRNISRSSALHDILATHPARELAATWGGADPYLKDRHCAYMRVLRDLYPGADLLVQEGIGHWVQHEAAADTASFALRFLQAPVQGASANTTSKQSERL